MESIGYEYGFFLLSGGVFVDVFQVGFFGANYVLFMLLSVLV